MLGSPCSRTKLSIVEATMSARANKHLCLNISAPSPSAPKKSRFHNSYTTTWGSRQKGPESEQSEVGFSPSSVPYHPRDNHYSKFPVSFPEMLYLQRSKQTWHTRGHTLHCKHKHTTRTSALGFLFFNLMNLGEYVLYVDGQTFSGALPDPFSSGCEHLFDG